MPGTLLPIPAALGFEEAVSRLALAFGVGLLIGLERGWSTRDARPGSRVAGVRTFGIAGLLGGLIGTLAGTPGAPLGVAGALLLAIGFATFAAVILVFTREASAAAGNYSATSAMAALLTFALGACSVLGNVAVAVAAGVAAAGVLAFREGIHRWVAQITRRELESGLALLAMSFIALPIVPDRAIGPFGGVNLREVWLIAIVLATISFAAYVAARYFGERRGVLIAAAVGGIVSSTAVAFSNARRASAGEGSPALLAEATALAMAVSFSRVIAITGALAPSLLLPVAAPLLVAALVAFAFATIPSYRNTWQQHTAPGIEFRNPFGFWSVLLMAASMGILIVLGRVISERLGAAGAVSSAVAMGLFDVDAMTVSMTRLVPDALAAQAATWAILAGVASNTFTKVLIAAVIGRGRFATHVAVISVTCMAAAALTLATIGHIAGAG